MIKNLTGILLLFLLSTSFLLSQEDSLTTFNTYWFFKQPAPADRGDPPRTPLEYREKVNNLANILQEATEDTNPILIGLQEVGDEEDITALANALSEKTGKKYQPLFVQGKDTYTGQDIGALLQDPAKTGWNIVGRPARHSDLEKRLSKHMVVTLEKENKRIHVAIVHLRVPSTDEAKSKHRQQIGGLLRWAMRHLAKDPNENVVIMGDFNEKHPPSSLDSALRILTDRVPALGGNPPLIDTFLPLEEAGRPITTYPKLNWPLDRILVSPAIAAGINGIQATGIQILAHDTYQNPRTGSDHLPVTLMLKEN